MKQYEQKRNLAFYKRSGEPWTQEEYENICKYCNAHVFPFFCNDHVFKKYIFDHGKDNDTFMHTWYGLTSHYNFKNCKQVAYENIFNEDGTVKGEQMKEEVVTVGSKKELAELLMSEPGVKWTSDEFIKPDLGYCIYDESRLSPFRFISEDGDNDTMERVWNIKTWRKVKPQFKRGDLVMCWDDEYKTTFRLCVWNEKDVFFFNGYPSDSYDHYEQYTGPVPKHIQDFINEMKAKEK